MFGGAGLYADGVMFGLVHRGVLHLRVSAASRERFVARGAEPFEPRKGVLSRKWLSVPDDVLDDADELTAWAREAVRAAAGGD